VVTTVRELRKHFGPRLSNQKAYQEVNLYTYILISY